MNKKSGIHFYINIKNFDNVVINEEERFGAVNHSIHALDTLFSSVERFGNRKYKDIFVVEKITGARLHMYFKEKNSDAINALFNIASYAYAVALRINKDIAKYKNLTDFKIQMGADVGDFFVYEFWYPDNKHENLGSETTTIGYPANYAAKLQALAETSNLNISADLYALCDDKNDVFQRMKSDSIKKYGQTEYYSTHIMNLGFDYNIDDEMRMVSEYAGKINLTDMSFSRPNSLISFHDLSVSQGKEVVGVPLFADVRGFTAKFYADGSNLESMAVETQMVLEAMYNVTTMHGGIHVQFQGDREMALFHDIGDEKCVETAILAGMRMIDKVGDTMLDIHLGTGCDYGKMYAAKIGARGNRDNILVGETVLNADRLEDESAKENQIAISEEIYNELKEMDSNLVGFFKKNSDGDYIATVGYKQFLRESANLQHNRATKSHSYNGAWNE